jgi:poly(beta-D-mannuronate) lyase
MSKSLSLFLIAVSLTLYLAVFNGCGTTISSIERQQNIEFKVNNPNASYFDVQERMMFLNTINTDNIPPLIAAKAEHAEFDCSIHPIPEPVDYYLVVPAVYENFWGWLAARWPLQRFEDCVTGLAHLYVITGKDSYVECLAKVLSEWAEKDSLLWFDYQGNSKQAWFEIEWTTASAGLAYSIVRGNISLRPEERIKIEGWLNKVAKRQISYQGGPTSCCNNHAYWRGLEAVIVGVVTNDNHLFRFGIKKYISAIRAMNEDGSFPLEMGRGERAIHYQNFAILPLVYIAEIAARQGYDLYGLSINGRDLYLAINFLMRCIEDHDVVKRYTNKMQDTSFITRKGPLNWMEPYIRRFKNKEIEAFLERQGQRPVYHTWSGGGSTLYFYSPDTE